MTKLEPILFAIAALLAAPRAHADDTKLACIAAADQGQQLRDDGRYREARDAFLTCARPACPALIARSCTRWTAELELAMPTIVLAVRDPAGADIATARVSVDGRGITESPDGMPIAVDP